tara:strand:- start:1763 stop:2239 length:477 start_codon:yes stop_codon:yes gene_type:complete
MVVSAALLLPNIGLIQQILTSDAIGWLDKGSFFLSLYGSLKTNFTVWSAAYLIVVALLFGLNIALLVYYIRRRQGPVTEKKAQIASIGGAVSAFLGIGCAACGSVVLTAVFGLAGAGAVLTFLPLHGLEFGLVGIFSLSLAIRYLAKKINDPLVCPLS